MADEKTFKYGAASAEEEAWMSAKNKMTSIIRKNVTAIWKALDAACAAGELKRAKELDAELHAELDKLVAFRPEAEQAAMNVIGWYARIAEEAEQAAKEEPKDIAEPKATEQRTSNLPSYTFPDKFDERKVKVVNSNIGGSTGAKLVEIDGLKYIMKDGGGARNDHVSNEAVADQAYRAAGVRVPDCKTYVVDGRVVKLAQFVDGGQSLGDWMRKASAPEKERMRRELLKGYPLDALFGNWDVLGTGQDNVLVDKDGNPWRIDNGSAFMFRAQGAKKKPEEWQNREFPDEWRTLRTSTINGGVFDKYTAHDIFTAAQAYDFDAIVAALPAEQKTPALIKCAHEMQEMANRCRMMDAAKFVPDETSRTLEGSYELAHEGLREVVASVKLTHNGGGQTGSMDYGFFREGGAFGQAGMLTGDDHTMDVIAAKLQKAAKSINHHLAKGGDANQATITAALMAEDEIKEMAAKGKDVAAYKKALNQIKKVWSSGKLQKIGNVPDYTPEPVQGNGSQKYGSISEWVVDFIERGGVEGGKKKAERYEPIQRWQDSQAGNSWREDSCLRKIFEYESRGIDPKPKAGSGLYGFTKHQKRGYASAWETYKQMSEQEKDTWRTALSNMRAANQIILENLDLPNIDKETGTILLARTENGSKVMPFLKGENGKSVKVGSFGTFKERDPGASLSLLETVVVEGSALTIQRVPFSRVSGNYLIQRKNGSFWGDSFLGDRENEMHADIYDPEMPVFYAAESVSSARDLAPYYKQFLEAEKKLKKSK